MLPNETIVLSNNHVSEYIEVVITTRNIICVQKGRFRQPNIVKKYPLSSITLINGEPQIQVEKSFSEKSSFFEKISERNTCFSCNVILNFKNESLVLTLCRNTKLEVIRDSSAIVDKIRELITGVTNQTVVSKDTGKGFFSGIKNTVIGAIGAEPDYKVDSNSSNTERVSGRCISCRAPLTSFKGATVTCAYCDTKQVI